MGLDWAAIRADYEKRATPEELTNAFEASPAPKKAPRRASRATGGSKGRHDPRPGRRKASYDRMVELYRSGTRVKDIASQLGVDRSTVSKALTQAGIPAEGRGGPTRKEVCHRGHPMKDAIELKGGGRACLHCKRDRDRANQRARRARREEQERKSAGVEVSSAA